MPPQRALRTSQWAFGPPPRGRPPPRAKGPFPDTPPGRGADTKATAADGVRHREGKGGQNPQTRIQLFGKPSLGLCRNRPFPATGNSDFQIAVLNLEPPLIGGVGERTLNPKKVRSGWTGGKTLRAGGTPSTHPTTQRRVGWCAPIHGNTPSPTP